jgi:hypothetical protein
MRLILFPFSPTHKQKEQILTMFQKDVGTLTLLLSSGPQAILSALFSFFVSIFPLLQFNFYTDVTLGEPVLLHYF